MILGLMVLLLGCATSEDVRILHEDSRQFQSQLNTIQKETELFRKDLETVQKENLALKADVAQDAKKITADLLLRLETLKTEVQTGSVAGGIYNVQTRLENVTRELSQAKGSRHTTGCYSSTVVCSP